MSEVVIRVENLSKEYRLGTISHGTLHRDLQSWWAGLRGKDDPNSLIISPNPGQLNNSNERFWALKDISFDVKQGEIVGIIGRNGAGKSTLLKILSRVTGPTTGSVKVRGRIASLLEVGTGFHPELTGRENIYLNGTILGMTRKEIDRKFDEIVDFADIEKFIDTPVKRYSSGMYVRLAFAVAAHMDPEILIVDEVLAVGDAAFQKKCLGKMGEVAKGGRTVLFVSHNMVAVENLCNRCICLQEGIVLTEGETTNVIFKYLSSDNHQTGQDLEKRQDRQGTGKIRTTKVVVRNSQNIETNSIKLGEPFKVTVYYEGELNNAVVGVIISNGWIEQLMRAYSYESFPNVVNLKTGKFSCYFEKNYLMSGEYSISIWLGLISECVDYITNCIKLSIEQADVYKTGKEPNPKGGLIFTEHYWDFSGGK